MRVTKPSGNPTHRPISARQRCDVVFAGIVFARPGRMEGAVPRLRTSSTRPPLHSRNSAAATNLDSYRCPTTRPRSPNRPNGGDRARGSAGRRWRKGMRGQSRVRGGRALKIAHGSGNGSMMSSIAFAADR